MLDHLPILTARLFYGSVSVAAKAAFDVRIGAFAFAEAMKLERRRASLEAATYDLERREAMRLRLARRVGATQAAEERYLQTYRRLAPGLGLPPTAQLAARIELGEPVG